MAELSASPIRSKTLKRIADTLRELQGPMGQIIPGTDLNPYKLLPAADSVENWAYGNSPFSDYPSVTNRRLPVVKTGRQGEVTDLADVALMGASLPAVSKGVTKGANFLGDVLTQAVTRNPNATSVMALDEISRMSPMPQITVYHGSPYLFSRFDPMKVGTGEGAQAYGVGAGYTSEARPIAEKYAMNVSRSKVMQDQMQAGKSAAYANEVSQIQQMVGDMPIQDYYTKLELQASRLPIDKSKDAYAKLDIVEQLGLGSNIPAVKQYAQEAGYSKPVLDWIEKDLAPQYKPAGYLYKGEIPDEIVPKFLDWDKPIKDQPEILKSINPQSLGLTYKKLENGKHAFVDAEGKPLGILQNGGTRQGFEKNWMNELVNRKGSDLYQSLSQSIPSGGVKASEALNRASIRGIRYTNIAGNDLTSNYVPFRPEDFKVQEINDIPLSDWYAKGFLKEGQQTVY